MTPEYGAKIAEALDGHLDFINVDRGSMYNYDVLDQNALQTEPLYQPTGYGTYMSRPIKARVKKTKIGLAGRITDALMAETILEKGQADFLGMTRALIADSVLSEESTGRQDSGRSSVHRDLGRMLGEVCRTRLSDEVFRERGRRKGGRKERNKTAAFPNPEKNSSNRGGSSGS